MTSDHEQKAIKQTKERLRKLYLLRMLRLKTHGYGSFALFRLECNPAGAAGINQKYFGNFSGSIALGFAAKKSHTGHTQMERLFATYFIETPLAVEKAAAVLAGEQSSGTFVAVPGETEELKQRFAARVEKITPLEIVSTPSLPTGRSASGKYQRAEIAVSWSLENFGYNLPTLVSTVQGNLYELSQFTGLKLMDLEFPASYADYFRGPKFGVTSCRQLTGAHNRPLSGTIIKPSLGMTPQQTADLG